jgi:hypothetical protein
MHCVADPRVIMSPQTATNATELGDGFSDHLAATMMIKLAANAASTAAQ